MATVPSIPDLILDLIQRDRLGTGMGLPEPIQDLLSQFTKRLRRLSCRDPAIGLTLDKALPQLTVSRHAYPRLACPCP